MTETVPIERRRNYYLLILSVISMQITASTIYMVLPLFFAEYGITKTQNGLLISIGTLAGVFSGLLAGKFSDSYGRKWILVGGTGVYAVVFYLFALLNKDFSTFLVLRFFEGVGFYVMPVLVSAMCANIFAKRPLRGNYEEIADYIYNRVGAVGVAWGAMSQKASSIASGCWRLGIPVIVGPHGSKYRRNLLGAKDREEDWVTLDARTGGDMYVGPVPEHLFYSAESIEEAIVMTAKLSMRPNDTTKGRAVKLSHYIDLHKKYFGTMPFDLELFVRREADIPFTMKEELMSILEEKGWVEDKIGMPDPTLLDRMVRKRE